LETLDVLAQETIKNRHELRLPFGKGRTSPIAGNDVAFAVSKILLNPEPHIGKIYELTGSKSETLDQMAEDISRGLGIKVIYVNPPLDEWVTKELEPKGLPTHIRQHMKTMAWLHQQNRYDRHTDDFRAITGREPVSVEEWFPRVIKAS
jgi:uncharacterized protein YbjT (DUF2867 family)